LDDNSCEIESAEHDFQACSFNHSDISPSLESIAGVGSVASSRAIPSSSSSTSSFMLRFDNDIQHGMMVAPASLSCDTTVLTVPSTL
jgi:hypothetical protein